CQDPAWSLYRPLGDLRRHAAAPASRDPAAATRRRAEGDARQEGHRSGTLTRSARSANSSKDADCDCPTMMRSRVGSKYPLRRNHNDRDRSSLLAWLRGRSCGTARLALEDNGRDSSALLWTFVCERPEGSGGELFAFCCPYRFFIDVQTKAR